MVDLEVFNLCYVGLVFVKIIHETMSHTSITKAMKGWDISTNKEEKYTMTIDSGETNGEKISNSSYALLSIVKKQDNTQQKKIVIHIIFDSNLVHKW